MKKKLLLIALVTMLTTVAIKAQNPVLNLSNYLRNSMLEQAYTNMKIAKEDERYNQEARTWQLIGNLYYNVFRCYNFVNEIEIGMPAQEVRIILGDPRTDFKRRRTPDGRANLWEWDLNFDVLFIDGKVYSFSEPANGFYKEIAESPEKALAKAMEAYLKVIEIDPQTNVDLTFPNNPVQGLAILSDGYLNLAASAYNQQEWESAYQNFLIAHQMKMNLGMNQPEDTIAGYYAVLSASILARLLSEDEKYEEALEVIESVRSISPDNVDLALSEADTYLKMRDFVKTKELLEEIITKQPDNAQLFFVIGNIYDELAKDTTNTEEENKENMALSVRYYKRAIEIDPDYFDALFNLGTVYNNRAVDLLAFANTLRFPDPRMEEVMKEANKYFRKALPYLEKAHNINPKDPDPVRMLYSIYLRLRMNEEAEEIRVVLEAIRAEREQQQPEEE